VKGSYLDSDSEMAKELKHGDIIRRYNLILKRGMQFFSVDKKKWNAPSAWMPLKLENLSPGRRTHTCERHHGCSGSGASENAALLSDLSTVSQLEDLTKSEADRGTTSRTAAAAAASGRRILCVRHGVSEPELCFTKK
jgi:hypothetical protein